MGGEHHAGGGAAPVLQAAMTETEMTNALYAQHKQFCGACAAVDDLGIREPHDGRRRCAQGALMVKQLVTAGQGEYR